MARVEIRLHGRTPETRRADGQLVFLIQITDRDGKRYQDHGSIELSQLDENIKAANLEYSQRAFFLPGDYRLAVAILDTATREHSTRQVTFRVAPPQHDLLPDAWRDLPPVEFIGNEESPDSWYLPGIHGRLQWAALKSPGAWRLHPSSASVKFPLALLCAIEVVIQFESSSAPPQETGNR